MTIKPLLAATVEDINNLRYPLLASPKIDGIRCMILNGQAVTRSLKPIPNHYIRGLLSDMKLDRLDGEIIFGADPSVPFQQTTSAVMSRDGCPMFTYWVFDHVPEDNLKHYMHRYETLLNFKGPSYVSVLSHLWIYTPEELTAYEEKCTEEKFEGVMLRDPKGRYKFGRSTLNEGILMKLKRFLDDEAVIVDFEERMHNDNEATVSELGYTKRSSHKDGKRPAGDLGALWCSSPKWGGQFKVGSGFDSGLRIEIWNNREAYLGKICKFKHLPYGAKDLPRHPIFLGIRDPSDMSE